MTVKWNGANLIKTIADNENSTANLYRTIAQETRIGEVFFEQLANDEERHNKIYNALLKKYEKELDIQIEETDAEFMDMLIENNTTFDEELINQARNVFTKSQIFDIAERAERDALLFVQELQRLYPDIAKDEIKIILNEEKKHLKKVLERKRESQPLFGRGM